MVRCVGCGCRFPDDAPAPYRCPGWDTGDDIDHLLVPEGASTEEGDPDAAHPFVRFAGSLELFRVARRAGLAFEDYRAIVEELDEAVARIDGRGFRVTPLIREETVESAIGGPGTGRIWAKDETGNVGDSHKARHLFSVLIHLRVAERLGWRAADETPRLAIASCGNAALAAAILAAAARLTLEVFVPVDAEPALGERMDDLGARVTVCVRDATEPGDPCVHAFRRSVADGAVPFSVQGTENGLVIEGGTTLGLEWIEQCRSLGAAPNHLLVQVGGGALGHALIRALTSRTDAPSPRIHTVQTLAVHPLKLAYDRVVARIRDRSPRSPGFDDAPALADWLRDDAPREVISEALEHARHHRSEFMRPWPRTPQSIARGILDDETYDWHPLVEGMIRSGGVPIVVDEERLATAHDLARRTRHGTDREISVTGAAGLAGLIEWRRRYGSKPREQSAIFWTGRH